MVLIAVAIACGPADGQEGSGERSDPRLMRESPGEFQFVRLAYSSNSYSRQWRGRQPW